MGMNMKKFLILLSALALLLSLCACTAKPAPATPSPAPTAEPEPVAETAAPEPAGEPDSTEEPEDATAELPGLGSYEGGMPDSSVTESFGAFLENNFDVIAALWPDGISGIGFVDLDLDETPEMLLFDMGASAAMGVQFFDLVNGEVVCVSSVNEAAAAAFGGESFSSVAVCAQLFGDFRLLYDGEQSAFYVRSANGTPESSWEEIVRFAAGGEGKLTLRSVCRSETETDIDTGEIISQTFFCNGEECGQEEYAVLYDAFTQQQDLAYEAYGVFLWNDPENYDTSLEGLLAMLKDAAAGYSAILG